MIQPTKSAFHIPLTLSADRECVESDCMRCDAAAGADEWVEKGPASRGESRVGESPGESCVGEDWAVIWRRKRERNLRRRRISGRSAHSARVT